MIGDWAAVRVAAAPDTLMSRLARIEAHLGVLQRLIMRSYEGSTGRPVPGGWITDAERKILRGEVTS
jgi:hypothetical protein